MNATSAATSVAIGWRLSSVSGWGVYGTNLALELVRTGRQPILYLEPHLLELEPEQRALLDPVFQRMMHLQDMIKKGTVDVLELDAPVLHALRNDFVPGLDEQPVVGPKNLGVIFFEDTAISDEGLARAARYDRIVTGSTWNADILKDRGLKNVVNIFQGVDVSRFTPRPRLDTYRDQFVIFSGGKLEYRKGQDVVVAAFKIFQQRHPEALLIYAWANQWPQMVETIGRSQHVSGAPRINADRTLDTVVWLDINGVPMGSFIDLGMPPNRTMPDVLAAADVAVFPNRCEPGTNLVAMEAMAAGLPCIIADNTGQKDLIADGNCYPLSGQGPVDPYEPYAGTEGWQETSVEETVERLEEIYNDREEAARRGAAAARFMRGFSWEKQIDKLIGEIDALIAA